MVRVFVLMRAVFPRVFMVVPVGINSWLRGGLVQMWMRMLMAVIVVVDYFAMPVFMAVGMRMFVGMQMLGFLHVQRPYAKFANTL
jgi:hypothetical protein